MNFEPEEPLDVNGRTYRSIWGHGTEAEIDHLLDEDAPAKGWGLYRREHGRVQLLKPPLVDESQPLGRPPQPPVPVESEEEWRARTAGVVVPEGKVICARCAYVDRTVQTHGFVKCGTSRSRGDLLTKHTWMSPVYPRECREYAAPGKESAPPTNEGKVA